MNTEIHFCNICGSATALRVPSGDSLLRHCCAQCGHVQYQNPKLVLGTLPVWHDKVLLCKRAIEPRLGLWTLPAGFMENHETMAQGALRETEEESGAPIELQNLYTLISVPHISQIHGIYLARLLDLNFNPGEETLEVRMFSEDEIPWGQIAFRTIALTLRHFFADRKRGEFPFRSLELGPPEASSK